MHKRAVAVVHAVAGWPATYVAPTETSNGQEDVQTFALEAAERMRLALDAAEQVLACELFRRCTRRGCWRRSGWPVARGDLPALLDQVAEVLPPGVADRPRGEDVDLLRGLLSAGWALDPSCP